MAASAPWTSLAVFISSTFRDMDAERDVLRDMVFPELSDRLRARRCELLGIDLRWGVDTMRLDTQEAKEAEVLSVCLREIERSRPFILVLLGDRYGWVPSTSRIVDAAEAAGVAVAPDAWSVTHLEVEQGVFNNDETRSRAVALIRAPLPYHHMPAAVAARYSDAHAADEQASARVRRLATLKQRLAAGLGERAVTYEAGWDGEQITGLEEFAAAATEQLWAVLDEATQDRVRTAPPSWQDGERLAIEAHVVERGRDVFGRDEVVDELRSFCSDGAPQTQGIVVVGESGVGKSAVMAQLAGMVGGERLRVLHHVSGITATSTSSRAAMLRWCTELADHERAGDPELSPDAATTQLAGRLGTLLTRAGEAGPVVLLVDAVDQLADGAAARRLTWLPAPLPPNVRVVASVVPGEDAAALADRRGWRGLALKGLTQDASGAVVDAVTRRRRHTMFPALRQALVARGTAAAGQSPLWLRLAAHDLLELGAEEYRRLETLEGAADERLERLLVTVARDLPDDLPGLYDELMSRAGRVHGAGFVDGILGLVGASRHGLRETDLAAVTPAATGQPWEPLRFARLRRQLGPHLVERQDGRWDFTHRQGRQAARGRVDEQTIPRLHDLIAEHLTTLPDDDPVAEGELAHHRIGAGDLPALVRLLADPVSDAARDAALQAVAGHLVTLVEVDPVQATFWLGDLLAAPGPDGVDRCRAAAHLVTTLTELLDGTIDIRQRLVLLDEIRQLLVRPDLFATDTETVALVVHTWLRVGSLHLEMGDLPAARAQLGATLDLASRFEDAMTVTAVEARCPECDALLIESETPFAEAAVIVTQHLGGHSRREASRFVEGLAAVGGEIDRRRDIADARHELGIVEEQLGDLAAARRHHAEAARIHRRILGILDAARELQHAPEQSADPEHLAALRAVADSVRRLAELADKAGAVEEAGGHLEEARRLVLRRLELTPGNRDGILDQAALEVTVRGHLARQGRHDEAAQHCRAALGPLADCYRRAPDDPVALRALLRCHVHLVWAALDTGELDDARHMAAEAEALARSVRRQGLSSVGVAELAWDTTAALAAVDAAAGDRERALDRYDTVIRDCRRTDTGGGGWYALRRRELDFLLLMGDAARSLGDIDRARRGYEELVTVGLRLLAEQPTDQHVQVSTAVAQGRLGALDLGAGEHDRAAAALSDARRRLEAVRDEAPEATAAPLMLADVLSDIGLLRAVRGELHHGRAALALARETLEPLVQRGVGGLAAQRSLAAIFDRTGALEQHVGADTTGAAGWYQQSLALRMSRHRALPRDADAAWEVVHSHERLAAAAASSGDRAASRRHLEGAAQVLATGADQLSAPRRLVAAGLHNRLGAAAAADEDLAAAAAAFQQALRDAALTDPVSVGEAPLRWTRATSLDGIGQCERISGRPDRAAAHLDGAAGELRELAEQPGQERAATSSLVGVLEQLVLVAPQRRTALKEEAETLLRRARTAGWEIDGKVARIARDLESGAPPWSPEPRRTMSET